MVGLVRTVQSKSVLRATARRAPACSRRSASILPGLRSVSTPPLSDPPMDLSADGRWILLSRATAERQSGVQIADLHARTEAQTLLDTEFDEPVARLSPRAMAGVRFRRDRTLRSVCAQGAERPARWRLASRNITRRAVYMDWARKGSELFYLGSDRTVYSVRFSTSGPMGNHNRSFVHAAPPAIREVSQPHGTIRSQSTLTDSACCFDVTQPIDLRFPSCCGETGYPQCGSRPTIARKGCIADVRERTLRPIQCHAAKVRACSRFLPRRRSLCEQN